MTYHKKRGFKSFTTRRKIITAFFLVLFVCSIAFIVVPMTGGMNWNLGVWFPTVYFLLLFLATYNLELLKKILKKTYRPLIYIFYSGMGLFLCAFIIFCALILSYTSENIPENPDLIIVLGCQVRGESPGNLLRHRLEAASETINKYPGAYCVVAGGQGPDEIIPEAVVMKKYLINKGADENKIFEESKSSTSYENLIFAKEIIDLNNIKHENIIIVTSNYHVPRAVLIAKRIYPEANFYTVKASSPFALFSAGITREFFAFVKSYIFDRE